jgi:hypothetical protein
MNKEQASPAFVGVAAYLVHGDGTLDAVWTTSISSAERGLGTERLSGGVPGELPGTYTLGTFDSQGRLILQGTTTITQKGKAYALHWDGSDGSTYDGIGVCEGDNVLAASYWPSVPASGS